MYQPTIKLTESDIADLHAGTKTIQCGQWVQIPWCDAPSRYVGRSPAGSIWAVHCHKRGGRNVMDGGTRRFTGMAASLRRNRGEMK